MRWSPSDATLFVVTVVAATTLSTEAAFAEMEQRIGSTRCGGGSRFTPCRETALAPCPETPSTSVAAIRFLHAFYLRKVGGYAPLAHMPTLVAGPSPPPAIVRCGLARGVESIVAVCVHDGFESNAPQHGIGVPHASRGTHTMTSQQQLSCFQHPASS